LAVTAFLLFAADSGSNTAAEVGLHVRPGFIVVASVFISGSSGLMKQVKGWRRFDRGRLDAIGADLTAASLIARKRESSSPRPQGRGNDRAIDPMSGKNTSA
jgi:hypothetical protein